MTEEVNAYAESADGVCSLGNGGADLGCLLRDIFLSGSGFDYGEWRSSQGFALSNTDHRILRSLGIEEDDREISDKDIKELIDFQRLEALSTVLSYPSVFKKTLGRKTLLQYALERRKICSAELLMKLGAFDSSTKSLINKLKPEMQKTLNPYLEAWKAVGQELPISIQRAAVCGDLSMLSLFFKDNPDAPDRCGQLKLTLLDLAELAGQEKTAEHLKSLGRTSHSEAFLEIREGRKPKPPVPPNKNLPLPPRPFKIPRRPDTVIKESFAKESAAPSDFQTGEDSSSLLNRLPLTQEAKDLLQDQRGGRSENELKVKYGRELFESCRLLLTKLNIGEGCSK